MPLGGYRRFVRNSTTIFRLKGSRIYIGKGKAIPLQAWTGLEGSRRLRLQVFKTNEVGKVVSPSQQTE